ncbi:histidine kinase [Paraflavisolibacter sp. H34]|uniref:sensor histidine kinase n=1 Tax=Huijunlia imazamoxiresistens TaxID=3127457 RepID=UPI00301A3B7C
MKLLHQTMTAVKLYPFSILSVLLLLLQVPAFSQRTDTAKVIYSDKNSWEYKMETGRDPWMRTRRNQDFQVYHKYRQEKQAVTNGRRHIANGSYYGNATLNWLNDVSEIELAAAGITRQNADSFIYHVTLNDSVELVPWSKPREFRSANGFTYAYLGRFAAAGRIIRLELYKTGKYFDRSESVFNSLYLPPAKLKNVVLAYNDKYLFKPYKQHFIPISKQLPFDTSDWKKDAIKFHWSDSINHLRIEMDATLQNDMYNVYLKRTIDGKTDTAYISNNWEMTYYTPWPFFRINSSFFNRPGRYEILVVPEAPEDFRHNSKTSAVSVPFTVLANETTLFSLQQVLLGLGGVLLAGSLLFAYVHRRNKSRLAQAAQQQEIARLQLTSVRAQLNPHFVFNALAGIQNLINKNEILAANSYLSRFARITRGVLDEHKTDLVSITDEMKLLHDYLQMEQLRFGFRYTIEVDEAMDVTNTELPAMLLQPFAENAVKHGVARLKEGGLIEIRLRQQHHNLVASVRDNGPGFLVERPSEGRGLALSKKRIELLNTFYTETPILLDIQSGTGGTLVSITLQNWMEHACTARG